MEIAAISIAKDKSPRPHLDGHTNARNGWPPSHFVKIRGRHESQQDTDHSP